jgi:hypothetical protein
MTLVRPQPNDLDRQIKKPSHGSILLKKPAKTVRTSNLTFGQELADVRATRLGSGASNPTSQDEFAAKL